MCDDFERRNCWEPLNDYTPFVEKASSLGMGDLAKELVHQLYDYTFLAPVPPLFQEMSPVHAFTHIQPLPGLSTCWASPDSLFYGLNIRPRKHVIEVVVYGSPDKHSDVVSSLSLHVRRNNWSWFEIAAVDEMKETADIVFSAFDLSSRNRLRNLHDELAVGELACLFGNSIPKKRPGKEYFTF